MMKTVLFLLAVWCLLGLAQFAQNPSQPRAVQSKPGGREASAAAAPGTGRPGAAAVSVGTLDVF